MNEMGRLYDLDELILKCHGPSARAYIEEAVMAYKVGAYRSSIITTWIAVYFDLVDKLRVHDRAGVSAASTWMRDFEEKVAAFDPGDPAKARGITSMEGQILNCAKDPEIGIITAVEWEDLKRLREDRHRCAHPTFLNEVDQFVPTAERARNHIRAAIDGVLSKRSVPGRLLTKRIISHAQSSYFPTEVELAAQEIGSTYGSNLDSDVVSTVTQALIDDILDDSTTPSVRAQRSAAVNALHELNDRATERALESTLARLTSADDSSTWSFVFELLRRLPWAWASLEPHTKGLVKQVLSSIETESIEGRYSVLQALAVNDLVQVAKHRLSDIPLALVERFALPISIAIVREEVIRRLESSMSFGSSKEILNFLNRNIDEEFFSEEFFRSFLHAAQINDQVYAATGFENLLSRVLVELENFDLNPYKSDLYQLLETMRRDHRVSEKDVRFLEICLSSIFDPDSVC